MINRSIYANQQDEVKECGHRGSVGELPPTQQPADAGFFASHLSGASGLTPPPASGIVIVNIACKINNKDTIHQTHAVSAISLFRGPNESIQTTVLPCDRWHEKFCQNYCKASAPVRYFCGQCCLSRDVGGEL